MGVLKYAHYEEIIHIIIIIIIIIIKSLLSHIMIYNGTW